jgi:succinate dehydrogenase / fumarate reductase membrane anchor subunit
MTTRMESAIAQVRGLGSAREGGHHWWMERMTSVALFLLYLWLGVSLLRLGSLDYATVREWLADPWAAVPMLLLVYTTFLHLRDGLKVAIEDYVHDEGNRFFALLILNFAAVAGGTLAIFSLLRIAFAASGGGGAGPA